MTSFKLLPFFLLLVTHLPFAKGQPDKIDIQFKGTSELMINNISISKKTKVKVLMKMLGEPSSRVNYSSGEVSLFYEAEGLVFFTSNGLVTGCGINFNWDGDDKFPQTTFSGLLKLGETSIDKDTKNEMIAGIESVDFVCPFPMMCTSKNQKAEVKCTAAFREEALTQVVFLIR